MYFANVARRTLWHNMVRYALIILLVLIATIVTNFAVPSSKAHANYYPPACQGKGFTEVALSQDNGSSLGYQDSTTVQRLSECDTIKLATDLQTKGIVAGVCGFGGGAGRGFLDKEFPSTRYPLVGLIAACGAYGIGATLFVNALNNADKEGGNCGVVLYSRVVVANSSTGIALGIPTSGIIGVPCYVGQGEAPGYADGPCIQQVHFGNCKTADAGGSVTDVPPSPLPNEEDLPAVENWDWPTLSDPYYTITDCSAHSISVLDPSMVDPSGLWYWSIFGVDTLGLGSASLNDDGTGVTYTPLDNGTDTLTFTVRDDAGTFTTTQINVSVSGCAPLPPNIPPPGSNGSNGSSTTSYHYGDECVNATVVENWDYTTNTGYQEVLTNIESEPAAYDPTVTVYVWDYDNQWWDTSSHTWVTHSSHQVACGFANTPS
ncbi:hypothetical protein KDA_49150 [Dictyobacter alpinus]|uniref:Cadherin domain-containing protein n=1 Tax=Dictyobacter alpinus TaxID=2014873 RepID=A0A402BDF4_9CHLR|nr:hypothetical protein [Dictyobacter alpinus]GCE29431.1 hypothetical protein KDA_49150 [Dictyobacter alpinus]